MVEPLTQAELDALARWITPALANGIEPFGVRPNNQGFAGPEIRPIFPEMGTLLGYARTVRVRAEQPDPRPLAGDGSPLEYWRYVGRGPAPRVVVVQDLDPQPVGAFFGEVNSNVHKALGCVGAVTNGGVRDVEEMRAAGFRTFAPAVLVAHAYVHIVDYGVPVQIGRLHVVEGDLIQADQHGVLVIPHEIARELPRVCAEIERLERELIDYCRQPDFKVERLAEIWRGVIGRWPKEHAGDRPQETL